MNETTRRARRLEPRAGRRLALTAKALRRRKAEADEYSSAVETMEAVFRVQDEAAQGLREKIAELEKLLSGAFDSETINRAIIAMLAMTHQDRKPCDRGCGVGFAFPSRLAMPIAKRHPIDIHEDGGMFHVHVGMPKDEAPPPSDLN